MGTASSERTGTPLAALQSLGQSVWLDDISRTMIETGELARLIDEDGLQGMTSNPSIFHKSITSSTDYDADVAAFVAEGLDAAQIYERLTVADIQAALDAFRVVYDRTSGGDGFVSLEVSPLLAHDTAGTTAEAKKLWKLLGRENAMIKIPGTPEGLPSIEEALFSGINVNVTLLFSVAAYEQVAKTYIRALERRLDAGLPIDRIASVASFFVSRIDTEVDKRIAAKLAETTDSATKSALEGLLGKIAIANAKNAYRIYQNLFEDPKSTFVTRLAPAGAKVQRVLWASVGTKNKSYPDTLYTAGLIGPETVSTMPRSSYDAFKDHGVAEAALLEGMDQAAADVARLGTLGVDLDSVTDLLLADGVRLFEDAFKDLDKALETKRRGFLEARRIGSTARVGELAGDVARAGESLREADAVCRLWAKDTSLWKDDPAHAAIIANSLGWLTVADVVRPEADALAKFSDEIVAAGFESIVVMGMGGSSLCVEVVRRTNIPVAGHPRMLVLDSTVPATIRRIEAEIDPLKTLFVVASKSGTTIEPSVFYEYFFDVVKRAKGDRAGENFVAITDPGTKMDGDATRDGFRKIFRNPSDIGGRYSALSFFGMVPAALMGLDVARILDNARVVIDACKPDAAFDHNPGARLGAELAGLAAAGRDKITLVTPPPLEALGLWIEQLIAESTGKEGKGVLPVAGEPLTSPAFYGDDRVFILIRTLDSPAAAANPLLVALARAGHPVVELILADVSDLAGEFFRWEIATPLLGRELGIDPFDQPNVQESKDNTKELLAAFTTSGKLPELEVAATFEGLTFSADSANKSALLAGASGKSGRDLAVEIVRAHLARVRSGDYVAITQYFDESDARDHAILELRTALRDKLRTATTTGYGPRFLHSTGQFHKGGPDTGVFLQLSADDGAEVAIPGRPYGFGTLVKAQAIGDFQSLAKRGRRALAVHLGADVDRALTTLRDLVAAALAAI
ncbi:MAG: bifunctional transaldolase/phosoglucose isomerase [Isosphaeraceae bacterium]|nr:bifunctional transaldolase/phosoglucose isomerase [Isosphaeraceae bacterium]